MKIVLRVIDVFRPGNRTVIAVDKEGGELRGGNRFQCNDGSEFVICAVSFATSEAWAAGRRGLEVEVITGQVVPGQTFSKDGLC